MKKRNKLKEKQLIHRLSLLALRSHRPAVMTLAGQSTPFLLGRGNTVKRMQIHTWKSWRGGSVRETLPSGKEHLLLTVKQGLP
jgi:hypothetical protein